MMVRHAELQEQVIITQERAREQEREMQEQVIIAEERAREQERELQEQVIIAEERVREQERVRAVEPLPPSPGAPARPVLPVPNHCNHDGEQVAEGLNEQVASLQARQAESRELVVAEDEHTVAFLQENQDDLEQEVVDLHTELTKVAVEKERLAVQNDYLAQRLQRSESNSGTCLKPANQTRCCPC